MGDPSAIVDAHLAQIGAESRRRGPGEWAVRLPSERRGAITASLLLRERTLLLRTFFMRAPDRRHEDVYRRLLEKHMDMRHWRFALDGAGDIHLVAEAPADTLGADGLDRLLGLLVTYVDETFEGIMRTGFAVPEGTVVGPPPAGAGRYTRGEPKQCASL